MLLLLYVDDLLLTGANGLIADTKRNLGVELEMKDLGMMHYFLSMEVWKNITRTREVCSRDPKEVQYDGL